MNAPALRDTEGFIFDLDGTVYLGDVPLPHVAEAIALLRSLGKKVAFLTNSTLHHRRFYAEKLASMGIPASPADVVTSAYGTALWLSANSHGQPLTALAVGEEGLLLELTEAGVEVHQVGPVSFVVVGLDRRFSYHRLAEAQRAILDGARFIATNADPVFPTENGPTPGAGTIVSAVACASGARPKVIGKPRPYLIRQVLRGWRISPQQCLLVGDSLASDIAAAHAAGIKSALVLTGLSKRQDVDAIHPSRRPHVVLDDLGQFCEALRSG